MEVWGGLECTVNRVGDHYLDQLQRNGHRDRVSDLELFAQLGIKRIRYPVLWEHTAPHGLQDADWRWADERLARLRELDVDPIVGLVHHGSGPRHTDLLDSRFPQLLADYAGAVASRFPWVTHYTPINEPLTTARFSALYGLWFPHAKADRSFARALLNQCRATVLAMQAIRQINPSAKLIQTDDMGHTYATPALQYQADFENERRWLSWDLLCGKVDRQHALWGYLSVSGIEPAELDWFIEHKAVPDVIGLNHYITSDRFLSDDLDHFPQWSWGGNGRVRYADVEAVRALPEYAPGFEGVLTRASQRYGRSVALTEVHLGCSRVEQLRWLHGAWRAALRAKRAGADVVAITPWALLGSFDWNSLLTKDASFYECGVFDVRAREPRATALAALIRHMSGQSTELLSVVHDAGWWERPNRLNCGPSRRTHSSREHRFQPRSAPILVTGGAGTLGRGFGFILRNRGIHSKVFTRAQLDVCNKDVIARALDELRPLAIVNCAGYVRVDDAEDDEERCTQANVCGPTLLAEACAERGIRLATFSTDLVFDGAMSRPYVESSAVMPLNAYGRSKAQAEDAVLRVHPDALILRTSWFFGDWDEANFLTRALGALSEGKRYAAEKRCTVSPTYVPDLIETTLDLLIDGECGIWHLANQGALTPFEAVVRAAALARVDASRLTSSLDTPRAPRPSFSALTSERCVLMPTFDDALDRYIATYMQGRAADQRAAHLA